MPFIDVRNADDKIATSGAKSLLDLDLVETFKAIDSVATGRIPSLFCGSYILERIVRFAEVKIEIPMPVFHI